MLKTINNLLDVTIFKKIKNNEIKEEEWLESDKYGNLIINYYFISKNNLVIQYWKDLNLEKIFKSETSLKKKIILEKEIVKYFLYYIKNEDEIIIEFINYLNMNNTNNLEFLLKLFIKTEICDFLKNKKNKNLKKNKNNIIEIWNYDDNFLEINLLKKLLNQNINNLKNIYENNINIFNTIDSKNIIFFCNIFFEFSVNHNFLEKFINILKLKNNFDFIDILKNSLFYFRDYINKLDIIDNNKKILSYEEMILENNFKDLVKYKKSEIKKMFMKNINPNLKQIIIYILEIINENELNLITENSKFKEEIIEKYNINHYKIEEIYNNSLKNNKMSNIYLIFLIKIDLLNDFIYLLKIQNLNLFLKCISKINKNNLNLEKIDKELLYYNLLKNTNDKLFIKEILFKDKSFIESKYIFKNKFNINELNLIDYLFYYKKINFNIYKKFCNDKNKIIYFELEEQIKKFNQKEIEEYINNNNEFIEKRKIIILNDNNYEKFNNLNKKKLENILKENKDLEYLCYYIIINYNFEMFELFLEEIKNHFKLNYIQKINELMNYKITKNNDYYNFELLIIKNNFYYNNKNFDIRKFLLINNKRNYKFNFNLTEKLNLSNFDLKVYNDFFKIKKFKDFKKFDIQKLFIFLIQYEKKIFFDNFYYFKNFINNNIDLFLEKTEILEDIYKNKIINIFFENKNMMIKLIQNDKKLNFNKIIIDHIISNIKKVKNEFKFEFKLKIWELLITNEEDNQNFYFNLLQLNGNIINKYFKKNNNIKINIDLLKLKMSNLYDKKFYLSINTNLKEILNLKFYLQKFLEFKNIITNKFKLINYSFEKFYNNFIKDDLVYYEDIISNKYLKNYKILIDYDMMIFIKENEFLKSNYLEILFEFYEKEKYVFKYNLNIFKKILLDEFFYTLNEIHTKLELDNYKIILKIIDFIKNKNINMNQFIKLGIAKEKNDCINLLEKINNIEVWNIKIFINEDEYLIYFSNRLEINN